MQDAVYSFLIKVLFPQSPLYTDSTGATDKTLPYLFPFYFSETTFLYQGGLNVTMIDDLELMIFLSVTLKDWFIKL